MDDAIGIIRVSHVGGRDGESFISPTDQRSRIETLCEREQLRLSECFEELDTSGGRLLEKRPGLLQAVEAVEAGEAKAIVVAYASRLARSLTVKEQVVKRVEAAGGRVLTVDFGPLGEATASDWLSGTLIMAFAEYQRREAKERFATAQENAVRLGIYPFPEVAVGYIKTADRRLIIDPKTAPIIVEAFAMRDAGKSVRQVHAFLKSRGVERKLASVAKMLTNPLYIGRLEYGKFVNLESHAPIIDAATFKRVQERKEPSGRRAKSDKLLARLGILRCASCGSRMTASNCRGGTYELYRCGKREECAQPVSISAPVAEAVVSEAVKRHIADVKGRASMAEKIRRAEQELEAAQQALSAAIEAFSGLEDVQATKDKLATLKDAVEAAQERRNKMGDGASLTILGTSWDDMTFDQRRSMIRSVIHDAVVRKGGQGAERIHVRFIGSFLGKQSKRAAERELSAVARQRLAA
jgi:site-specific DNA recombinase